MATLRAVPRSEWRQFFDRVSKALLLGKWAEIEVASLETGDQILAEWIPMIGVTYDSRDDLLDVALDRTDHLVYRPQEIFIEEDKTMTEVEPVKFKDGTEWPGGSPREGLVAELGMPVFPPEVLNAERRA